MNNKVIFLSRFIDEFLDKGVKRRSFQTVIGGVEFQINKIARNKFDKKLKFNEDEIIEAFKLNDFTIMNNFGRKQNWEKWKNGTELPESYFINVKSSQLKRLISTIVKTPKENWKPETILEVENLKISLNEFWESNKHILN
ncbi:hypothetical protein KFZ70_05025 [Tamlana fucoidanivorans]|uniref:Uncharacterized protein n=1 Tax=Allotamlana fucoidanivorans TaxID=2583814 RepID=A0A5C4SU22_9FLAO|nr:hypothetical protein [Tamlana fucoidanivorans]TNJ47121.1 hypothetical protein FGF67_00950 [Tamlana fucoidanivorans]